MRFIGTLILILSFGDARAADVVRIFDGKAEIAVPPGFQQMEGSGFGDPGYAFSDMFWIGGRDAYLAGAADSETLDWPSGSGDAEFDDVLAYFKVTLLSKDGLHERDDSGCPWPSGRQRGRFATWYDPAENIAHCAGAAGAFGYFVCRELPDRLVCVAGMNFPEYLRAERAASDTDRLARPFTDKEFIDLFRKAGAVDTSIAVLKSLRFIEPD